MRLTFILAVHLSVSLIPAASPNFKAPASRESQPLPADTLTTSNCEPMWTDRLFGGGGSVSNDKALAVYDDGAGPAIYVAGGFTNFAGVAQNIAKWDGVTWSALAGGLNFRSEALTVFDSDSGSALYVGGQFTVAGSVPANRIASWNGVNWTALGAGLNNHAYALAVFDDGTGPALFVGGTFTTAGGVSASRIAKWNGSTWSALSTGVNGTVRALFVFNDGSAPALYVAGEFTTAGGISASRIAKWNGSAWSALGTGLNGNARALEVFDDGSGPSLYVGGEFTNAGGLTASRIAKWNGTVWSTLNGTGMNAAVLALGQFYDGVQSRLYASGSFTTAGGITVNRIAKWTGATWAPLDTGLDDDGTSIVAFDDGSGSALYVAGDIATAGGIYCDGVARWNGTQWRPLTNGLNDSVNALAPFDDGTGLKLFVGGSFQTAGSVLTPGIAKWNGQSWEPATDGADMRTVVAFQVFNDGTGPQLFAGGDFQPAWGSPAFRVAKWDGQSWNDVGFSFSDTSVRALAVFDDGTGPALYAGGSSFNLNGPDFVRFDGKSWTPVAQPTELSIQALTVFDDGSGPALYVGGDRLVASTWTTTVMKWDGALWSVVASFNTSSDVYALFAFLQPPLDGLYVGGVFTSVNGVPAQRVARWDGLQWSSVGHLDLNNYVYDIASYDDGEGPHLYVAGSFSPDSAPVDPDRPRQIAKLEPNPKATSGVWRPLGSGIGGADVLAMASVSEAHGTWLYVGGRFTSSAGGYSSDHLARWGCPSVAEPIPAVSHWGLACLLLLVLCSGTIVLRHALSRGANGGTT